MAPITNKLCKNKAHKLRREDKGDIYVCDGCKTDGKGLSYVCEACGDNFHHECIDFKRKICPVMFEEEKGSYDFKFMSLPPAPRKSGKKKKNCPGSRNCEACGMPVKGCLYHCIKTDKDLHPRCAFLDKEIIVSVGVGDQVKLILSKAQLNSSTISDCRNICQSAELPAAAAGLNEKIPGWCYISDDGEINLPVFCMLQIWSKNSTETEITNNNGGGGGGGVAKTNGNGPKLQLEELEANYQPITETQDIKSSKKNQAGRSRGGNDPKLPAEVSDKKDERETLNKYSNNKAEKNGNDKKPQELDKKVKRETTQDKYLEKKGAPRDDSRGGASKENGNNAKMELVKTDRDLQIQNNYSKKKKKGGWGGRKTEFCLKIFETVLSAVISALIGDFSGLAGEAAVQFVNFFI